MRRRSTTAAVFLTTAPWRRANTDGRKMVSTPAAATHPPDFLFGLGGGEGCGCVSRFWCGVGNVIANSCVVISSRGPIASDERGRTAFFFSLFSCFVFFRRLRFRFRRLLSSCVAQIFLLRPPEKGAALVAFVLRLSDLPTSRLLLNL